MKINYRKDIDGLRSLAILAVVLFHFFPLFVKGGFVGVDIFFVISGYLITSIILLEADQFSFLDFFSRRIRRIFPALLIVVASSIIAGYYLLYSHEYVSLAKHVLMNSVFSINFQLVRELGYFDTASDLKPLLNLWSLAVEEQFYFVWPLLLVFAIRRSINTLSLTSLLILISFIINIKLTKSNNAAAFYMPFSRVCELLLGCLLAQISQNKSQLYNGLEARLDIFANRLIYSRELINKGLFRSIISCIGFMVILIHAIFFNKTTGFPGIYILIPTLAAVCIIWAGPNAWINSKILSNKFLVWIGKISYPLYLWHWPLLSFVSIVENNKVTYGLKFALLLISFILAQITYSLVERPIKK